MQKAGASQIYHILLLDDEPLILMGLEDEACACGFEVLLERLVRATVENLKIGRIGAQTATVFQVPRLLGTKLGVVSAEF